MSQQQPTHEKQLRSPRRFPWWIIPVALVLIVAFSVGWLFRFRIQRLLEPAPTLPPALSAPGDGDTAGTGGLLYQTDFADDEALADWELFDDGVIAAAGEDGQLVVSVNALMDAGGYSGLNYTLDDFVLEVDATKLDGPDNNAIFVVFRMVDGQNYNRFDISSDGYYSISRVRDGVQSVVSDWMPSPAINTGDGTNRLRVEAVGDTFRFAVNGEPLTLCVSYEEGVQPIPTTEECVGGEMVEEWVNDDLPRGKVGLGVQGYTGFDGQQTTPAQATVAFDNVEITAPGG